MKKTLYLLLFFLFSFSLFSCDKETPDEGDEDGDQPHTCEFVIKSPKPRYIKTRATCTERAEYYYSCSCGEKGSETFYHGEFGGHQYAKKTDAQFLAKEASVKTPALYYKSCSRCGALSADTFAHGAPIQLSEEEKRYLPTSVTVTFYNVQDGVYGITYNSLSLPLDPVIQIKKEGEREWTEYSARSYESSTLDEADNAVAYYISKAEIILEPGVTYVYRACDKGMGVATPELTLKARDPNASSFTFSHVSDSQAGSIEFGRVMGAILGKSDFAIHTGDVVQNAKYEYEWTQMLEDNYEAVTGMPIMAISGNHEVAYSSSDFATVNHFNNLIPDQTSLAKGYYYSFVYGNIKFIMLNTNDLESNRLKPEQYAWLVDQLRTNTCKWTIVSMHNPLYSVGKYGSNEEKNSVSLALREQLGGIFAEYGVDLVLQGHDHTVSRTFPIDGSGNPMAETVDVENGVEYIVDPSGVIYAMNGPAGSQSRVPEDVYDEALYAYVKSSNKASWADITVTDDTLTVTVKCHNGSSEQVYYTFGIKKS